MYVYFYMYIINLSYAIVHISLHIFHAFDAV